MRTQLKSFLIIISTIVISLALVISYYIIELKNNSDKLRMLEHNRYLMIQKADELRQSSDDLTRFARTYAVTADEKHKESFFKILDIRNGEVNKPVNYENIYWDLLEPIRSHRHPESKNKLALKEIMQKLPYTSHELEKLKTSEYNSNDLVNLEVEAFNAMVGLYKDNKGEYTIRKEPDQQLAIEILHSNEYHLAKQKIMLPIDEFLVSLNERTAKSIDVTQQEINSIFGKIFLILVIIFALFIFVIYYIRSRKLLYTYSQLEDEINKKTLEIEKQSKVILLQSRIAAIAEMLNNISHQWRQPLNVISVEISNLKLKSELGEEINNEIIEKTADNVVRQTQFLSFTIENFRKFFLANTEIKQFDIKDTVYKLNEFMKEAYEYNNIRYKVECESILINQSEGQLLQALVNISNNAKDILKENVSDINERYVFISLKHENNTAVLKYRDSGGGIADEYIGKIFEPYFTTKHQYVGTGIGLYITYQIITKQFHGTLDVENVSYEYDSKQLKGAEFTITIPL